MKINTNFVNAEYLLTKAKVNEQKTTIIISVEPKLWHIKAEPNTVKKEIADKIQSTLPDYSLEEIEPCISVKLQACQQIGNISLFGYREGLIQSNTFKIEIGKNLFFSARNTLLSESLNNQVRCSR